MKRILVVAFAASGLLALSASAEDKSNGCGLGWQVTQKTSFLATSTRYTTNVFVPPTFGMTTGTLGCARHSIAKRDIPAVDFAVTNRESLAIEMAEGRGEYLTSFARTLGCADSTHGAFGRMTQEKYESLSDGSGLDLFFKVKQEIRRDPFLASGCNA